MSEDFIMAVEKMRCLQKEYFRKRDHATLLESKKQEAVVDGMIRAYKNEAAEKQQRSLF